MSALFKWTDATGGTPNFCSTNISPVLGLQVTVSWGSNQSITDQAILNFPASGNLTDGYLAVQVNGDPVGRYPADRRLHQDLQHQRSRPCRSRSRAPT